MFLIVCDSFSKWIETIPMRIANSTVVIIRLREIFAIHGVPHFLVSDNGPSFSTQEFKGVTKF